MLKIVFSIGVNEKHKEEIRQKLHNFDISFGNKPFFEQSTGNVYFSCISDMKQLKNLMHYLNYEFKDTALLTY